MLVRSVSVAQFRCPSDWLCLVFFSYLYRWCQLALYLKSVTLARSSVEIFIYASLELGLFVYDLSCFMSWKDTLLIHNYFEYLSILDSAIIKITVLSKNNNNNNKTKPNKTKRY